MPNRFFIFKGIDFKSLFRFKVEFIGSYFIYPIFPFVDTVFIFQNYEFFHK